MASPITFIGKGYTTEYKDRLAYDGEQLDEYHEYTIKNLRSLGIQAMRSTHHHGGCLCCVLLRRRRASRCLRMLDALSTGIITTLRTAEEFIFPRTTTVQWSFVLLMLLFSPVSDIPLPDMSANWGGAMDTELELEMQRQKQ